MSAQAKALPRPVSAASGRRRKNALEAVFWYAILCLIAGITILPFAWVLLTSLEGPHDGIYSVPPQFIPHDLTFQNYARVWQLLPMANFFVNSIVVAVVTVVLNLLFTSLAAYPFAKMKFRGRDAIFFLLSSFCCWRPSSSRRS